jgi:hypothetical protein
VVQPKNANNPAPRATCYFSTPGRMRNCFPGPQAHIFLCKGELRLAALYSRPLHFTFYRWV